MDDDMHLTLTLITYREASSVYIDKLTAAFLVFAEQTFWSLTIKVFLSWDG